MVEINNNLPENVIDNLNKHPFERKENNEEVYPYNNVNDSKANINENIEANKKDEKVPLINKLRKVINNINDKLNERDNKDKNLDLEQMFKNDLKNEDEKEIKSEIKGIFIVFAFILGGIFVIINLTGIFTIKNVLDTLFKTLKDDLVNYLFKKSNLEKNNLTDFKNLFLSSYNFYENYYQYISSNDVDFNLIMFWDFLGLFSKKYCGFSCTSFIYILLSSILIVLILAFNFLDIDKTIHKYFFSQILYLLLVYLFLWIVVGAYALLSQNLFIESIMKFYQLKQKKLLSEKLEKERNEQLSKNNANKDTINNNLEAKRDENIKIIEDERNYLFFFPILLFTIFSPFFINYLINRKIFGYMSYYISKKINDENNDSIQKIYSKQKSIFLICTCVPYFGEVVLSLIPYFIFKKIFAKKKNEKEKNNITEFMKINNNNKNLGNNIYSKEYDNKLTIKEISIKKICGYTILNQTLTEKNRKPDYDKSHLTRKFFKNCCYNCKLICKTLLDCFKNTICYCFFFDKYSPTDNSCCCCENTPLEPKETNFCLCYQEKGKLEWIRDSFNNKTQRNIIKYIYLIFICQFTVLGFEAIHDEKKEKNNKNRTQENILIPLLVSFSIVFAIFLFIFISYIKNRINNIKCCSCCEKSKDFYSLTLIGVLLIEFVISILSLIFSSNYLKNKNSILDGKKIYYPIFINKFTLFFIYYFCLKQDEKNEMISHSSFASLYIYISELILDRIKKLIHLKGLIIIQIVMSSLLTLILFCILCPIFCSKLPC